MVLLVAQSTSRPPDTFVLVLRAFNWSKAYEEIDVTKNKKKQERLILNSFMIRLC